MNENKSHPAESRKTEKELLKEKYIQEIICTFNKLNQNQQEQILNVARGFDRQEALQGLQ